MGLHTWRTLSLAACSPLPLADNLSAAPSPTSLSSPVSNSSYLFTWCQSLYASSCTIRMYCTVRLKMFYFSCLFFTHYLCEKYHKSIKVQYCTTDCVRWVPRLTLLDLTSKLNLMNVLSEQNSFICRGLAVFVHLIRCFLHIIFSQEPGKCIYNVL